MNTETSSQAVDGATDPSATHPNPTKPAETPSTNASDTKKEGAATEAATPEKKKRKKVQLYDPRPTKAAAQKLLDQAAGNTDATVVSDTGTLRERLAAFDACNTRLISSSAELVTLEQDWLDSERNVRDALLAPMAQLRGSVEGGDDVIHRSKARGHFATATNLLNILPAEGMAKLSPPLVQGVRDALEKARPAQQTWSTAQSAKVGAERDYTRTKQELQRATMTLRLALKRFSITQPKVRKPRTVRKPKAKAAKSSTPKPDEQKDKKV